jgi:hypothetical protein
VIKKRIRVVLKILLGDCDMTVNGMEDKDASVDSVRRKLLKIGIYAVPAIMFLGRAKVAKATGPNGPPFGPPFDPPGPPPKIPPK